MKKGSKLLSLVLVICLAVTMFAACSNNKANTDVKNDDKKTDSTTTDKKDNDKKDSDQASKDEVTKLDIFINLTYITDEQFVGIIPDEITKRTNVTLNTTKAADDKQLGLMIASGTLPDLVFTGKEVSRLSDPNICYSYDELIKNYVPDFKPNAERIMNARSFSTDDNYYTILSSYGTKEDWDVSPQALLVGPGLIFRRDLYEELGSPELKTTEDFKNLLIKAKNAYPDLKPFVFNPIWRLSPLKVAYGVPFDSRYSYFDDNNGSIQFGYKNDNYLDYLKYMNGLYKEGLVTADNFAIKNEQNVYGEFEGGKSFSMTWADAAVMNSHNRLQVNVPKGRAGLITGLSTKNQAILPKTSIGGNGLFVTKNCKAVEQAATLVKFLYSKEGRELTAYGREGIDWTRNEDNSITLSDELMKVRATDPDRIKEWNTNFMFGKRLEQGVVEGAVAQAAGTDVSKEIIAASDYNKSIVKVNPKLRLILPKADTNEKVVYDKLVKLFEDYEAKMILAENETELMSTYEKFKEIATKMGAEDLEKKLTTAYQALK